MYVRTFAALFTAIVIFFGTVKLSALQSNAAPTTSQPKSAQAAPAPSEDPTKKLGAFVGKWESEGAFTSGQKTSTTLECRWSPQGSYLGAFVGKWETEGAFTSGQKTSTTLECR